MSVVVNVFSYEIEQDEGSISIRQESFGMEDSVITISLDQLPLLVRHLRELCPPSPNAERQQRYRDRMKASGEAQ